MKSAKRIISFSMALCLLFSSLSYSATVFAVNTTKKTMLQYTFLNLSFEKPEGEKYKCSVSNNRKSYIKIDAQNEGNYYWLTVSSKKATPKNKVPTITVYKEKAGKKTVVKRFRITVKPVRKIKMKNTVINKGTGKIIKLINPYDKEYNLIYNKKTINISQYLYDGNKAYYTLKGLKNGKTTVKAYLKGTKKLVGSFMVFVGDYKASIKKNYKNITIYYNSHIDTQWFDNGSFFLGNAINNFHEKSIYTVKADNPKLIGSEILSKTETTPKAANIYSKKAGKTKLTVYEKRGNLREKKIGTITLRVKKAKDSDVFISNMMLDNDGIFYELYLTPGNSYDLKKEVVNRYINCGYSNSHFDEDEYTFSATSNHPEIVSVDNNGICTCHAYDNDAVNRITYTVKFKDGSSVSCSGSFDIYNFDK